MINIAPGQFADHWIPKAKTQHYVVDITPRSSRQRCACLFEDDMLADVLTIEQELISIVRQLAYPGDDPSKAIGQCPRKMVLAGHHQAVSAVICNNFIARLVLDPIF
jgi:hypothetical protein